MEQLANDWLSGRRLKLEQLGFAADGLELPYNLCLCYREVPPPYGGAGLGAQGDNSRQAAEQQKGKE